MRYLVEFTGPLPCDEARVIVDAPDPDAALPAARRRVRDLASNPGLALGRPIDAAEFDAEWRVDVVHPAD
jgi:hypothetical protein